ncbi:MAG: hypothetical protein ACRDWB_09180, partial [Acidimicrobiales bacterium]
IIIDHGKKLAEDTPAGLTAGTGDGSIRFTTDPGIDTASLALAVGTGTAIDEEGPGIYRLRPPTGTDHPAVVAALAAGLAERGLALGDLRTGHSLEEAYLAITGSGGTPAPVANADPRRSRGRGRDRGSARGSR